MRAMPVARWWRVCRTTSLLCAGLSSQALAQTVNREQMVQECVGDNLAARVDSDLGAAFYRRSPEQTWRRMQGAAVALDFPALGDSVRALWDALSPGIDTGKKRQMETLLDTLIQELGLLQTDHRFRTRQGTTPRLFQLTEGDPGESWLINGSAGASAITLVPDVTSDRTVRAVCWTAVLALKVAEYGSSEARTNSIRVLGERGKRWDNFDRVGFSLTPLELLINGWCSACRGTLEPPRTQLVALHLMPSYVLRDQTGSRAALTTEVFGILGYNRDRSRYWGLSYALALPQEERREQGLVIHVSNLGQLGFSFRNGGIRRRTASLILSADLYRFIESWQGKLRDQRDQVKQQIARVGGGLSAPRSP